MPAETAIRICRHPGCGKDDFTTERGRLAHERAHRVEKCPEGCGREISLNAMGRHRQQCAKDTRARTQAQLLPTAGQTTAERLAVLLPHVTEERLAEVLDFIEANELRIGYFVVIGPVWGPYLSGTRNLATVIANANEPVTVLDLSLIDRDWSVPAAA